jgi:hypothetical protein
MNLFQKLLAQAGPPRPWTEPGISPAERRYRARLQAATAPQAPRKVNKRPDLRIMRNVWLHDIYGGIAKAPFTWRRGRIY